MVALFNIISRIGVPFFFIVAGYLYGKKLGSTRNRTAYAKKYLTKLLIISLCSFVFYFVYDFLIIIFSTQRESHALLQTTYQYLVFELKPDTLWGNLPFHQHHLWFLVTLIWSILIVSYFERIKLIKLLFWGSLIFHIIGLFGQSYSLFMPLYFETREALFFGLFYTTLGFVIAKNETAITGKYLNKINLYTLYALSMIFASMQVIEVILIQLIAKQNILTLGNYYISTIFATTCLFLICLKDPNIGQNYIWPKLGQEAIGIYLIHILFVSLIRIYLTHLPQVDFIYTISFNIFYIVYILIISHYTFRILLKVSSLFRKLFKVS